MRRAIIDIGTNTVKLLVADVEHGNVRPVISKDETTRLGEATGATQRLSAAAIARTVKAIARYVADAHEFGAIEVAAISTSAARDAGNGGEFLDAVRHACGLDVQIISGQREAELIFRGASSDPAWSTQPLLVLDVGGGSAEFIQGVAGTMQRHACLPLGAVRLTERFGEAGFADLLHYLRETLRRELPAFELAGRRMIGTGGAISTLARVAHGTVDHAGLAQDTVREWVSRLHALPLDERRRVPGLPPERADIIVAGGLVVLVAMETLGAHELTVSVRGLRYGAMLG